LANAIDCDRGVSVDGLKTREVHTETTGGNVIRAPAFGET
jgi:hypothetical protein